LSSPAQFKGYHWYPQADQLKDPATTARALKQVLDQFYALQDQHDALRKAHNELQSKVGSGTTGTSVHPPGSGPSDSMVLGLRILPVDVQTLADGTKLTFVKKDGNFQFK
jgi:hypothetical protein